MVPRLSKVLSQDRHRFRERDLATLCVTCGEERNIADCITSAGPDARSYRCAHCGDLLVLVGYPSDRTMSAPELRPGEWWSIRPTNDLFVKISNSRVTIPASVNGAPLFGRPLL